jgi:hypothetical protein
MKCSMKKLRPVVEAYVLAESPRALSVPPLSVPRQSSLLVVSVHPDSAQLCGDGEAVMANRL